MIFLLAIAFVLIGYLNPFLAIVYGVGLMGDRLLKSGQLNTFFLTSFVVICLLGASVKMPKIDFFQLFLLLLTVFVYFYLLLAKGRYDLAILTAGIVFFVGEALIFVFFYSYYLEIIEKAFAVAGSWLVKEQGEEYLQTAKVFYLRNYPALYGILGLVSFYFGSIVLGKKSEIPEFYFRRMVLPVGIDFCFLAGLIFFVFRNSLPWPIGSNLLIFLIVTYIFVGLGVIFTVWNRWFEKSKILYFLFFLVLVLNNYLLFILSFLGLADRWFDFRKLNRRKDESDFD